MWFSAQLYCLVITFLIQVGGCFKTISLVTPPNNPQLLELRALPGPGSCSPIQSLSLALNEDDIPLEEAFQDSVSLTDGPIGVLLAAFAVFVVLAIGFKAVMGEMDSAIEKVLQDFEATLKAYDPERWRVIEEMELKGLAGEERDIKLLQVMERLQEEEPDFMTQVANRGVPEPATTADVDNSSSGTDKKGGFGEGKE